MDLLNLNGLFRKIRQLLKQRSSYNLNHRLFDTVPFDIMIKCNDYDMYRTCVY